MTGIQAAIFDMDGLLIDSEPLWQDAELACFQPLGVPITRAICRESAGRRIDEVVRLWHGRFGWDGPSCKDMVEQVLAEVTRLIMERSEALPGVEAVVTKLKLACGWSQYPRCSIRPTRRSGRPIKCWKV